MTDQHNPHVAGFAGDPIVRTQNLDRLAAASIQFDAAYCQSPLCTPSRICLWTGRPAHRAGAWRNGLPIFPELLTLPEHLGKHGYRTCGVGKMHVGGERPMNGFQARPYGDLIPNSCCCHQPDPLITIRGNRWTSHQAGRFPFAGESEIPESLMQDAVVTRESLAFLLDHGGRNPGQPWFLCASYQRPHHPLTAPARYIRRYWPEGPEPHPPPDGFPDRIHPHDRFLAEDFRLAEFSREEIGRGLAAYYASVDFVDDCMGELMDGLERAGLMENTVVIYFSDHGDLASEHGLWWKRSYYEGSARVPLLVKLPGRPPGKLRVRHPVELVDLFPTVCDLCGVPTPEGLDGESLVPLFDPGGGSGRNKDTARCQQFAPPPTTFRMVRTPRWKYAEFPEHPPVLFDMENDPGEERNLAGRAGHAATVQELHRELWSDGESWQSLEERKRADIERVNREAPVHRVCSPNQYALPNGEVVDADWMLYGSLLEDTRVP